MLKEFLSVLVSLILTNILGLTVPALLAAWLFTLILPVPFNQMVWLSLGMFFIMRYTIQVMVELPGQKDTNFMAMLLSIAASFIFLALAGLLGWGLFQLVDLNLNLFETILLIAISMGGGFYFVVRSGTGGLPLWMTMPDVETEDFDDEYVVSPPKRRRQRRRRVN
jgi:hypothetical protein